MNLRNVTGKSPETINAGGGRVRLGIGRAAPDEAGTHACGRLGSITATCETCGKTFQAYPSRLARSEHHYCSWACMGLSRRTYPAPVELVCDGCGTTFHAQSPRRIRSKRHYCSRACSDRRGTQTQHGTRSRYRAGCRCAACRQVNAEYQRTRPINPEHVPKHGTYSEYVNYRCRCAACTAVATSYAKKSATNRRERVARGESVRHAEKHGTYSEYIWGCRCAACRDAMNLYSREYYQRKKERLAQSQKEQISAEQ